MTGRRCFLLRPGGAAKKPMEPMNATQQREHEIWILYSNLYLLNIGGVPESADMKTFAADLWQAQTRTKAVYFVWNDEGVDPDEYIQQKRRIGHHLVVDERVEAPPDASFGPVADEDAEMEHMTRKAELWAAAEAKWQLRGRERFDTSGLSAHGIVPQRPKWWLE